MKFQRIIIGEVIEAIQFTGIKSAQNIITKWHELDSSDKYNLLLFYGDDAIDSLVKDHTISKMNFNVFYCRYIQKNSFLELINSKDEVPYDHFGKEHIGHGFSIEIKFNDWITKTNENVFSVLTNDDLLKNYVGHI